MKNCNLKLKISKAGSLCPYSLSLVGEGNANLFAKVVLVIVVSIID